MSKNLKNNLKSIGTSLEFVISLIGITLSAILVLSSCTQVPEKKTTTTRISASSIENSTLSKEQKSEELANAAELLLTAEGFLQANEFATKALSQDSKNFRAGFIKAITDPLILFKGIHLRVKPLAIDQNEYDRLLETKQKLAETSTIEKFFLDGSTTEFKSEEELQSFYDTVFTAINNLRIFAKDHKAETLVLKPSSLLAQKLNEVYADSCELTETSSGEYEITCPDDSLRKSVSLNKADFQAIESSAAMYLFYISIFNAYDLTGLKEAKSLELQSKPKLTPQQVYQEMLKNPRFGILRKNHNLNQTQSLALDMFAGLQWFIDNYSTLCPKNENNSRNREGMLFYQGMCFSPSIKPYLQTGIAIVNGVSQEQELTHEQPIIKTQVNFLNPILHPLQDLRKLGPVQIDLCGNIISSGDVTLGGYFPKGDANQMLPLLNSRCELQ